jgi:hypothetical protein
VEQHQFNMAAQFNRRHRACKPRFRVGDWVRVRVKKHNKTDAAFSEPHRIVKMVAPFTVLIDNGSRWHMSKLKHVEPPPDEPDIVPDDDDMEQASDELPATPGGTAAPASNDGGHGGQGHVPSLTCFDDLHVSVQYQLDIKTIMSRDAFEGGGDVVDASCMIHWARPIVGVGLQCYSGHMLSSDCLACGV